MLRTTARSDDEPPQLHGGDVKPRPIEGHPNVDEVKSSNTTP